MSGTPGVLGYRKLTEDEINLINECKLLSVQVGELVEKVRAAPATDMRWTAIGQTDLQRGFMALIRAIARPTTF